MIKYLVLFLVFVLTLIYTEAKEIYGEHRLIAYVVDWVKWLVYMKYNVPISNKQMILGSTKTHSLGQIGSHRLCICCSWSTWQPCRIRSRTIKKRFLCNMKHLRLFTDDIIIKQLQKKHIITEKVSAWQ
jgi:hypothetical protein